MGVGLQIEWDDNPLRQAANRLRTFGDRYAHSMWDAIGAGLVAGTQLRFERQVDPRGAAWKPSQRALKTGGKTLAWKMFLFNSITHNVLGNDGVEVGSNLVYAPPMQFGADITMPSRSQKIFQTVSKGGELLTKFVKQAKSNFARWVTLPEYHIHIAARPYLGMSTEDETETVATAVRHEQAALLGERP